MNRQDAQAAVGVVGVVAGLGLLLPGIEKAWDVNPEDTEATRRLRTGQMAYLVTAVAVSGLASYAHGSAAPALVGVGLALSILALNEHYRRATPR